TIYRKLLESEQALSKAVNISPDSYFPLYGYGRTLLVSAQYETAAEMLQRALDAGAPTETTVDLAEAYFRSGQRDIARTLLNQMSPPSEPARRWMYDLIIGNQPSLEGAGRAFWDETARRFEGTPYGAVLQEDLQQLTTLTAKDA
ncbi:MAG: hypothetical protein AAF125_17470, partial [Chloroflexota bacterium]